MCYLQGMPDRMLCAVLEQFQLYFSLWYVRFVSIYSVISSCVLMARQPVHIFALFFLFFVGFLFFFLRKKKHTHTNMDVASR